MDPFTGTQSQSPKPVTALHINQDWDLAELTILDQESGKTSTLETTWHHPFWSATDDQWVNAKDLTPGERLRDDEGKETQIVVAVRTWTGLTEMRDLTVADVHTYYVIAGDTPVLVHNCGDSRFSVDSAGQTIDLVPKPKLSDQFPRRLIPEGGRASDVGGHIWGHGPKEAAENAARLRAMSPAELRGLMSRNDAYDLHAFYTLAKRGNAANVSARLRVVMMRRILDAWGG